MTRPVPRVVLVDGVPMSGILSAVDEPRATIVAVHGGATHAAYFDPPGHPELSLPRQAADAGFTVLSLDRPGFGASALYPDEFADTARRVEMTYRAIEAMLGDLDRGAGLFLLAHSNGSELVLRMAAEHPRGTELLGIEISGTGIEQQPAAAEILTGASVERIPTGLRELLWEPAHLYPDGVAGAVRITGGPISPGYEAGLVETWPQTFPALAEQVRVPVRFTLGEHERVWRNDDSAMAQIAGLFSNAPRVQLWRQPDAGHNLSLGHTAGDYHRSVLSYVQECIQ